MTNIETLGGCQMLKKWLGYREAALFGHLLTDDETLAFTKHVRRLTTPLTVPSSPRTITHRSQTWDAELSLRVFDSGLR